jgi:hypothetical protein
VMLVSDFYLLRSQCDREGYVCDQGESRIFMLHIFL